MAELNNVTQRRPMQKCESLDQLDTSVSINSSCSEELLGKSLDVSSNIIALCREEMKCEINRLNVNLESTQYELENVILENSDLKKQISQLTQEVEILKQICRSPLPTLRKVHSSANKYTAKRRLTDSFKASPLTMQKSPSIPESNTQPTVNNEAIQIMSPKNQDSVVLKHAATAKPPRNSSNKKPKISILSSETSNELYALTEETSLREYEICHYRKPKCGIKQILEEIEAKHQNFTIEDCCIIYIGEEDFRTTQNYVDLVMFIRGKLLMLTHTNIVICLPTYKFKFNYSYAKHQLHYGTSLYNSRLETFNNLLFMDAQTYEYAHILDSNLNLSYDFDMYNQRSGAINHIGKKIIISNLEELVLSIRNINNPISYQETADIHSPTRANTKFFRH